MERTELNKNIDLNSVIVLTLDLQKSHDPSEKLPPQPTPTSIPLAIPKKSTHTGQPAYWWVDFEARGHGGKWVRTGSVKPKQPQAPPPEGQVTRVRPGAVVHIKSSANDTVGTIARVKKVIGRDQYLISFGADGSGRAREVRKNDIIKPHYQAGGYSREMLYELRSKEHAKAMQNASPEGYRTTQQERLVEENKDGILGRAKKIYGRYKDIGIKLEEHGITLEDMEQQAMLSAYKHVGTFDPKRGIFQPYIYQWVNFDLRNMIGAKTNSWGLISIPREDRLMLANVKKRVIEIKETEHRDPRIKELADWLSAEEGIGERRALDVVGLLEQRVYSLDPEQETAGATSEDPEANMPLMTMIGDPKDNVELATDIKENLEEIHKLIDKALTKNEALAVKMKLGIRSDEISSAGMEIPQIATTMQDLGIPMDEGTVRENLATGIAKLAQNEALKELFQERAKLKSKYQKLTPKQ